VLVGFASFTLGCDRPTLCTVAIADTTLSEGQDLFDGFSQAHTYSLMAARGPDFWNRTVIEEPASAADLMRTLFYMLGLPAETHGARVLAESLRGNGYPPAPHVRYRTIVSRESKDGAKTVVHTQAVGDLTYYTAAGFPGGTVGIEAEDGEPRSDGPHWHLPHPRSLTISISPD
jgi:hypothetical protein